MRGMSIVLALIAGAGGCRSGSEPIDAVRIYALDCGAIELANPEAAAAVGSAAEIPGRMVNVCYLIRHPRGDLLWDLGLGDELADRAGGAGPDIRLVVDRPLVAQLAEIDLTPAAIEYIAFSHLHFDHTGNANRFPTATWIVNRRELAWARSTPTPFGVNPASWSGAASAKLALVDEDLDVFGDGSVRVLGAPGHTPGHQVLLVTFVQGGAILLGGDLYQTRDNVRTRHVPAVSHSRSALLASFDRITGVLARSKATLIVQHAPEDLALLPKFPLWLE
jgi:glyoxylase-like metal-dependent hydrolase (beta-lactamase superfamily II)